MTSARARLVALGALAALAACSGDEPSAPQEGATLDVSALLGEMSSLPAVAVPGAAGLAPFTAVRLPSGCAYVATSQSFVCPPVTQDGLTVNVAYTLLDAAGRPLAQADPKATAAMRTVTTAKGTITPPAGSGVTGTMTVDQRQEMTLGGLLTGVHRLDGTGSMKLDGTVTVGTTRTTLALGSQQTVAGLLLPAAGARWPTGGTIRSETTTGAISGAATTVRTEMTFDGTSTATLTITVGGVTQRCTVNLASPAATPVCAG